MTKNTDRPTDAVARTPRPLSMEITPIEYDHYMREAQRMRAEAMAGIVERWFAGFSGLFRRAKTDAPKREPKFASAPSRSAA